MTTWKDGGWYGLDRREITDGRDKICTVTVKRLGNRFSAPKSWPEGEANFRLILQAPQMLEALRTIAEGAIVSPDQAPEKIAEQVLRVLRIAREAAAEYMVWVGMQQKRAERAEAALEAIVALDLGACDQCKEIARTALAKEAPAKDEN